MSASDLFQKLCDAMAVQVGACFAGMDEETFTGRIAPTSMSPQETLAHLTDCCVALQHRQRGEEYEWGTFVSGSETMEGRLEEFRGERAKGIAFALSNPTVEELERAADFLCLHEAYHVGQLAMYRASVDPAWDAYSIYG